MFVQETTRSWLQDFSRGRVDFTHLAARLTDIIGHSVPSDSLRKAFHDESMEQGFHVGRDVTMPEGSVGTAVVSSLTEATVATAKVRVEDRMIIGVDEYMNSGAEVQNTEVIVAMEETYTESTSAALPATVGGESPTNNAVYTESTPAALLAATAGCESAAVANMEDPSNSSSTKEPRRDGECNHAINAMETFDIPSFFFAKYYEDTEHAPRYCVGQDCGIEFGKVYKVGRRSPVMCCSNAKHVNHECMYAYCKPCYNKQISNSNSGPQQRPQRRQHSKCYTENTD